jgi:hypothetical protein
MLRLSKLYFVPTLLSGLVFPSSLALFSAGCGGSADTGGASGASDPSQGGSGATGGQGQGGGSTASSGGAAGIAGPGGASNAGGANGGQGGNATGGSSSVGSGGAVGGRDAGGTAGGRDAGGTVVGRVDAGPPPPAGSVFSQSRFHFGTIDTIAKGFGTSTISQLDFFTSGWLQGDTFDHASVCTETNASGALANQVPVLVSYIAAAHVKRLDRTRCDCNVTTSPCVTTNDLCHTGAAAILQELPAILAAYTSYSAGFAGCYGTTRPIVFEMEPDWYQYTGANEGAGKWTPAQAGMIMGQLVAALRSSLPNARFSIDVSPWVGNNGTDNGAAWYANFDMTQFTFVNTSGGGTNAATAVIRSANKMTWAGLSLTTGKPILADTGYGANGVAVGEDPGWNVAANINARMADGVVSISQYNPTSSWGATVAGVRDQLNTPKLIP